MKIFLLSRGRVKIRVGERKSINQFQQITKKNLNGSGLNVKRRNCIRIQLNIYLCEKTTKFGAKTLFITMRERKVQVCKYKYKKEEIKQVFDRSCHEFVRTLFRPLESNQGCRKKET